MTQLQQGQEVEVLREVHGIASLKGGSPRWCKAKIFRAWPRGRYGLEPMCDVEFTDGTRAVFSTEHIRRVAD